MYKPYLGVNSSSVYALEMEKMSKILNRKRQALTHANYHIYPKYSDTSTPYHTCSKIWTSTIYYPTLCLKLAGWVDASAASHLGLHCLLMPVCPNTYGKYDIVEAPNHKWLSNHPLIHCGVTAITNKSCQRTMQLSGKSWSDEKTIFKYKRLNAELKHSCEWQSMTWLWCRMNVKLRDRVYATEIFP